MPLPLPLRSSLQIDKGLCFRRTLVDSMVCTLAASFWFGVYRSMGILDHMALVGVGFFEVVVWSEECILDRTGEGEGVDLDGAEVGLDGARMGCFVAQVSG